MADPRWRTFDQNLMRMLFKTPRMAEIILKINVELGMNKSSITSNWNTPKHILKRTATRFQESLLSDVVIRNQDQTMANLL